MGGAFFSGLSGLTASSLGIENVGNNLSNTNTVGFKKNNIFFQELIVANNSLKGGQGTVPQTVEQVFSQGNVQQSQVPTDLAIQGNGFFVVGDQNSQFFTRAGNFHIDREGRLVTADGLFVKGFPAQNGGVNINSELSAINISPGKQAPPKETQNIRLTTNLNSETIPGDSFTTSVVVFDSLGKSHSINIEFTKTPNLRQWSYTLTISPKDLLAPTDPNAPEVIGSGTITFGDDGRIQLVDGNPINPLVDGPSIGPFTVSGLANGAKDLSFQWQLFDELGVSELTQFNIPSATSEAFQDGNASGTLTNIIVRKDGLVEGLLSNGQTSVLGKLALASFTNPQGLVRVGNNNYAKTSLSGEPAVGEPGTGGRGEIDGGALEMSNVDISEEFIRLIIFQRAFQANSRLVTTADQVVQEAISLIR